MAVTQIIYLTQAQFGVHPVVHAVQNDTGRLLKMVVRDVALTGSPTAELYFTRSDDTHFHTNAEFESQDNSFTADISQALTQVGNTRCNLTVTDSNDKTVSSYPFLIVVHESQDGTSEAQLGYSIEEITEIIESARGGGMSEDVKQALLNCFYHVAWVDSHGQDYVDNLEEALYPPAVLTSITAYYNQTGTIYDTDDLDDLKPDLTVLANYDNGQSVPVSTYTLSGSLVAGTSTIRVNYDTKYTTFDVTVTHMPGIISVVNNLVNATNSNSATTVTESDSYTATISPASGYTLTGASVIITMGSTDITSSVYSNGIISIDEVTDTLTIFVSAVAVTLVSISAVYTQSGTVYNTDNLDSLKDDLIVTATWSDSSTTTVPSTDYTLSGTLTVGTSTVTVSYGGKTATFSVTVSSAPLIPSEYQQVEYIGFDGNSRIVTDILGSDVNDLYRLSATIGVNHATAEECILAFCGTNRARSEVYNDTVANRMAYYTGYGVGAAITNIQDLYDYPVDVDVKHDKNGIGVDFNLSVNGNDYNATNVVTNAVTSGDKFVIGSGGHSEQRYGFKGKIYSAVVYSDLAGTTKIGELIPCYRKSDNVIGIYDRINEAFYVNAGSGTLTKGSDV